jgi:hypothetical protein
MSTMTCICIAGASQPKLDLVAKVLAASGMKLLVGDKLQSVTTPRFASESQTERLQTSMSKTGEVASSAVSTNISLTPQRLSQVMQSAKLGELAGWADTNSLNALTEWLRLEPTLCFVLVTRTAEDALAQAKCLLPSVIAIISKFLLSRLRSSSFRTLASACVALWHLRAEPRVV